MTEHKKVTLKLTINEAASIASALGQYSKLDGPQEWKDRILALEALVGSAIVGASPLAVEMPLTTRMPGYHDGRTWTCPSCDTGYHNRCRGGDCDCCGKG